MDYLPFQIFGFQHLISLLICVTIIIGFPSLYKNKSALIKTNGAKIVAGLVALHLVTQPIYDILLFNLPWQDELPLHMCDF